MAFWQNNLVYEIEESAKMFEHLYNSAWADDTEYLAKRVLEYIPSIRRSYRFFSSEFKNLCKLLNEILGIVPGYYKFDYYSKEGKFTKAEIIKIEKGEEYRVHNAIRIFGDDILIHKCEEDGSIEKRIYPRGDTNE